MYDGLTSLCRGDVLNTTVYAFSLLVFLDPAQH